MHRCHISGLQRVGQHRNAHAALAQQGQSTQALFGRHEIGGDDINFVLRRLQGFVHQADDVGLVFVARQPFCRIVADQMGGGAYPWNAVVTDVAE